MTSLKPLIRIKDYATALRVARLMFDSYGLAACRKDPSFMRDWRRALIGAMESQRPAQWDEDLRWSISFAESIGALQPASALIRRFTDSWRWSQLHREEAIRGTEEQPLLTVLIAAIEALQTAPAELHPTAFRRDLKKNLQVCEGLLRSDRLENPIEGQGELVADLLRLICAYRVGGVVKASPQLMRMAKDKPRIGLLVDFILNRMTQLASYRFESWPDSRGRILVALAMSKREYSDYIAFDGEFDPAVLRLLPRNYTRGFPAFEEAAGPGSAKRNKGSKASAPPKQSAKAKSKPAKTKGGRRFWQSQSLEALFNVILEEPELADPSFLNALLQTLQKVKSLSESLAEVAIPVLERLLSLIGELVQRAEYEKAATIAECGLRLVTLIKSKPGRLRALPAGVSLERVETYLKRSAPALASLSPDPLQQIRGFDQVLTELVSTGAPEHLPEIHDLAQRIVRTFDHEIDPHAPYMEDLQPCLKRAILELAIHPKANINLAARLLSMGNVSAEMRHRLLEAFRDLHKERAALALFEVQGPEVELPVFVAKLQDFISYAEATAVLLMGLKIKLRQALEGPRRMSPGAATASDKALQNFFAELFDRRGSKEIGLDWIAELHSLLLATGLREAARELAHRTETEVRDGLTSPIPESTPYRYFRARIELAQSRDELSDLRVQLRELRKLIAKLERNETEGASLWIFYGLASLESLRERSSPSLDNDISVWQEGLKSAFDRLDDKRRWRPLYEAASEATMQIVQSLEQHDAPDFDDDRQCLPLKLLQRVMIRWFKSYPNHSLLAITIALAERVKDDYDQETFEKWYRKARSLQRKRRDPEVKIFIDKMDEAYQAALEDLGFFGFLPNPFDF